MQSNNAQIQELESRLGMTRDYERSIDVLRSELKQTRDHGMNMEQKLEEAEKEKVQLAEINKSRALGKVADRFLSIKRESKSKVLIPSLKISLCSFLFRVSLFPNWDLVSQRNQ